ncbi:hypothetical protein [Streptomyces sp. NPDC050534]|uniref:hypothetical protein n=1 Tax=Streptomyces sp. NPDC050534 TaxID=3365625 RepID=UPI0037876947
MRHYPPTVDHGHVRDRRTCAPLSSDRVRNGLCSRRFDGPDVFAPFLDPAFAEQAHAFRRDLSGRLRQGGAVGGEPLRIMYRVDGDLVLITATTALDAGAAART